MSSCLKLWSFTVNVISFHKQVMGLFVLLLIALSSCSDPDAIETGEQNPDPDEDDIEQPTTVPYIATAKSDSEDFSIAVLGDTQYYVENNGKNGQYLHHFEAKVNWIKQNRIDSNIVYVASVGDITENYDHINSETENQWLNASGIYSILEDISELSDGLPYGVIPGNHDVDYSSPWGVSKYYNEYFGISRFGDRDYYQEGYPEGSNENHYDVITIGNIDLMFVYLRWQPDPLKAKDAYDWAYEKIAANPDKKAIVITHYSVASTDKNYDGKLDWGLQSSDSQFSQAEEIYEKIKTLPNFFMMFGGHVSGEGQRQDTYDGNTVKSFTVNYQGNIYEPGLLRFIKFSSELDRIDFTTFVPGNSPRESETSTFSRPWVHGATTTRTNDFDNDGRTEPSFFKEGIWSIYGYQPILYGEDSDIPVPGDYNGNGKTTLAILREGTSNLNWLMPDQGTISFGEPGDIPVPGDYDGNGTEDLAVFSPSTGRWTIKQDYLPTNFVQDYGQAGDIPVPGDYDGDGKVDIALYRPTTAEWLIFDILQETFGEPGDIPVPGDYNGDGKIERAVYRPASNQWYVEGEGAPVNIGTSGDIPVPGDYDGNGRTDIAVYRPSNGNIYLSNGSTISTDVLNSMPINQPYAIQHFFFP